MGYLIDSSIFIAQERRGLRFSGLPGVAPDEPVALASITASELLTGVERADTAERRLRCATFVEAVLDTIPVIPLDLTVARTHARIWALLASSGRLIGAHDLLIAATALTHGYTVLTANVREFEQVPGLAVLSPSW